MTDFENSANRRAPNEPELGEMAQGPPPSPPREKVAKSRSFRKIVVEYTLVGLIILVLIALLIPTTRRTRHGGAGATVSDHQAQQARQAEIERAIEAAEPIAAQTALSDIAMH